MTTVMIRVIHAEIRVDGGGGGDGCRYRAWNRDDWVSNLIR